MTSTYVLLGLTIKPSGHAIPYGLSSTDIFSVIITAVIITKWTFANITNMNYCHLGNTSEVLKQ